MAPCRESRGARITIGNQARAAGHPLESLVVMDDFIDGEPLAAEGLPGQQAGHIEETTMWSTQLRLPELGLIAGTRGLLGAGIGLLLADKLDDRRRRGVGWTLVAIGVATTIPLAMLVLSRRKGL
jgi:hypothetical protein